ncbi:MAG: arginine--tRNA ligase, partial [Patescibacteria group bacterium]
DMGDFAVPCFYLAKLLRRSPNQIADDFKKKIQPAGAIKSVQNIGPYLNFFINPAIFGKKVLQEIQKKKAAYGALKSGKEKIMIEYSQPNTHKEFHIGHLRNAVLGNSLVNINKFAGHKVVAVNYIGDIGAHVAKCLWALEKFHQGEKLPENKGKYLGQVYTEAAQKTEANPDFKYQADAVLQKLETGDKKWLALWQKTRKWSLAEFAKIYKILGVKFADVFFESEVEKPGKKIVDELLKKGLAEKSDGAVIINLEKYDLKNFLLLKSDGSSLYSTKDLALAELKFKKYKIDKSIVITDSRQSFYFQQLFKTLEVMGFDKQMVHIPYEFVTLKDGAMSSRAGNVVLFEDFYEQVLLRAKTETKKRRQDWSDKKIKATAEKIALAAIKFNMLKTGNNNVIVFDIEEALSFDGFSGPYLQYTCSRISSVIKKAGLAGLAEINYAKLNSDIEKELMLKLAEFPQAVGEAVKTYQPSEVAKYLFDLARLFSNFYQKLPILNSEAATRKARLALVGAVEQVLNNGLKLLGIEPLREM